MDEWLSQSVATRWIPVRFWLGPQTLKGKLVNATTSQVSVLNASYEALGDTKVARALALVSSGKAVVEESVENMYIHSVGGLKIPLPKVIRLLTYINVPFHYSEEYWSKSGVLRRDKNKCIYCGRKGDTIDHIIPRSRFADKQKADTWMNTACACLTCNARKADRTPEEAKMFLMFDPWIPTRLYLKSGKSRSRKKSR